MSVDCKTIRNARSCSDVQTRLFEEEISTFRLLEARIFLVSTAVNFQV